MIGTSDVAIIVPTNSRYKVVKSLAKYLVSNKIIKLKKRLKSKMISKYIINGLCPSRNNLTLCFFFVLNSIVDFLKKRCHYLYAEKIFLQQLINYFVKKKELILKFFFKTM